MAKKYYVCECGSNSFIKIYNVWNFEIKVEISEVDGEELWDEKIIKKSKDHLYGYICKNCNKDAQELNDDL